MLYPKCFPPSYQEILNPAGLRDDATIMINSLVNLFPGKILMPTTKGGLGIIALSRLYPLDIHPIGLVRSDKTTHGKSISPQGFFLHDIGHANQYSSLTYPYTVYQIFHNLLIDRIKNFPGEKRKNIEWIYFTLLRELSRDFIFEPLQTSKLDPIVDIYYRDFKDYINFSGNYKQILMQIKQAVNEFTEVFSQITESQNLLLFYPVKKTRVLKIQEYE